MSACAVAWPLLAQEEPGYVIAPPAAQQWGSIHLGGGGSGLDDRDLLLSDMRRLAEGSTILATDLGAFRETSSNWWEPITSRAWAVNVSLLPFRTDDKRGPELRMGIEYAGGLVGELTLERADRTPYDTLRSATSSVVILVDSISMSRISMEHRGERIGVDGSLIFRTGGRSRWALFGGGGLAFGLRFNAGTRVRRIDERYVNYPGNTAYSGEVLEQVEGIRNGGGGWFSAYLPVGVSFRLARRGDLLGRMDLFLESRPGILVQQVPELGTIFSAGSRSLFGVRLRLDGGR